MVVFLNNNTSDSPYSSESQNREFSFDVEPLNDPIISGWELNGTVICDASGTQSQPKVSRDGEGGVVIVWEDRRSGPDPNDDELYVQRIDENGTIKWDVNGVLINSIDATVARAQICSDGDGGAIVVWEDWRNSPPYNDLFAQRVDENGTVKWTTNGIAICTASGAQWDPQIYSDGNSGAIIVWEDGRNAATGMDIYAQRIDSNGNTQWTSNGIPICTADQSQSSPKLVSDGIGGAIITWQDYRDFDMDIYVQRVTSSGSRMWGSNGIALHETGFLEGTHWYPEICSDGNGGAIVTWRDQPWGDSIPNLKVQRISLGGGKLWGTNGKLLHTGAIDMSGENYDHRICSDGNSGAIITWKELSGLTSYDIGAQRINSSGNVQWGTNGLFICNSTLEQKYPEICEDGIGGAYITWFDKRDGSSHIYVQNIDLNGNVNWLKNGVPINTISASYPEISSNGYGGAFIIFPSSGNILAQYIHRDLTPRIKINLPFIDDTFGTGPPYFNISVESLFFDKIWYTLDDGLTNYSSSHLEGNINQTAWDACSEGTITLRFYVNNTLGNFDYREVNITKSFKIPPPPILETIYPKYDHDGLINLNWSDVEGTSKYYIYRSNSIIKTYNGLVPITEVVDSNYTDICPSPDTYYYAIVATNSTGNSTISNCVSIEFRDYYERIHIDNIDPSKNWSIYTLLYDWCTGSGSFNDPYIISNVIINGNNLDSCIFIENSQVYFKIINSTLYNSGVLSTDGGLKLVNTSNGILEYNNCSYNGYSGILLNSNCNNNSIYSNVLVNNVYGIWIKNNCQNNKITSNIVGNTEYTGIVLTDSDNNDIINNTVFENREGIGLYESSSNRIINNQIENSTIYGINLKSYPNLVFNNTCKNNNVGIQLYDCIGNEIVENILYYNDEGIRIYDSRSINLSSNYMKDCGIYIEGSSTFQEYYTSHIITPDNLVNDRPVYYYANNISLKKEDFLNAGQIILANCRDSIISDVNVSDGTIGVSLYFSENNTIKNSIINNNNLGGFFLKLNSHNNTFWNNTISYQSTNGFYLTSNCQENNISSNILINNIDRGVYFQSSDCDNNIVSENIFDGNNLGIVEVSGAINKIYMNLINGFYDSLLIDNNESNGAGDITWVQAATKPWCNGSGTWNDPYIIKNLWFDGESSGSCLEIRDSKVFFRIEDCRITNSGYLTNDGGIKLDNTFNGKIINNNCSFNDENGITLYQSKNNTIINNILNDNSNNGIYLRQNSNNNTIINNTFIENTNGIYLYYYSDNNEVINNTVLLNGQGIYVDYYCDDNKIHNNTINENNYWGICLRYYSVKNNITNNVIKLNNRGIYLYYNGDENFFSNNLIINNTGYGIFISSDINDIVVEGNYLISNNINGWDTGVNNQWNNSNHGNYWSDYSGRDGNDDGIGDTPYILGGSAGSIDYFPIWDDGIEYAPYFINEPNNFIMIEGDSSKNITWTPFDVNSNFNFYWIKRNGSNIDNGNWDGSQIVYSDLASLGPQIYNFTCFVNDTDGFVNSSTMFVEVLMDIYAPNITIISPGPNELFGNSSFNFVITIEEFNLDKSWYSLNYGLNYTFTGTTGTINQPAWDICGNGTITISFYANDTRGNIAFKEVIVFKDSTPPDISILSPNSFQLFGNTTLTFFLSVLETNLDSSWYSLNGGLNYSFIGNSGTINQSAWDLCENGSVTIRFYANDTLSNIGMKEITVLKDNIIPIINIISPIENTLFNNTAPNFVVRLFDGNLNTSWYTLNGGRIFVFLNNETFNQPEWGNLPNGTVIITFYANDSVGNEASFTISVKKDIIAPNINIISPTSNQIFGSAAPDFTVEINDRNLDAMYYSLNGGQNQTFIVNETFRQDWWGALTNGSCILRFYANDSVGNLGYATVNVWIDAILPLISINTPTSNDIFNAIIPSFNVNIMDLNLDTMWYSLNGGINKTFLVNTTFDAIEWANQPSGFVTVVFYANDSFGNLNSEQVVFLKDIDAPLIVINNPVGDEFFGNNTPNYNVYIIDLNIDVMWYSINDGKNITFTSNGTIDQNSWTLLGDGLITIVFYANDTVGGISYEQVTIIKDTIIPTVSIISPTNSQLFGPIAPAFIVEINDTNLDSMWYSFNGGPNQTFLVNETFRQDWWSGLLNGTVSIAFYANDSFNYIMMDSVIVYLDIIAPEFMIDLPISGQSYNNTAPKYEVEIIDPNLDTMWYTLDNGMTNYTFTTNGTLIGWNVLSEGIVSIIFYANDTEGNINTTYINVIKDLSSPVVNILTPAEGDTFGNEFVTFSLTITDYSPINKRWYTLDGGTNNYTFTDTSGTLDLVAWNLIPDKTQVTIKFYATDSLGRVGQAQCTIYKDLHLDKGDNDDGGGAFNILDFFISPIGIVLEILGIGSVITLILIIKKKKGGYKD